MEAIDLNNLEQYFTIIYTMSVPNHVLHCVFIIVQNPKPIFYAKESFVGSLLNSGSCPKCVRGCRGRVAVFLQSRVCKNGSDLPK